MRKTKIVCTLGPASDTEEVIAAMADAGMNVARINFSHGTHEEHAKKIAMIKKIRKEKNIPLPVLLDTKGPEFRIRTFKNGKISLKEGDTFTFTTDEIEGDETRVSVSYKGICEDMRPGDRILLNNGLMVFEVVKVKAPDVVCTVVIGGELSNRKSMFFPEKELKLTYLSEQDKSDLLFGIEQGVDFVACSFVSKAQDIIDVRNFLHENGSDDIDLIAKIENRAGVNNLQSILDVSDGIMIGRGDMGVEIPYEELPNIQKTIISACRMAGKRCITATEMLESMIKQPRPTRAEISDVANAVYDGSSAVMLSGETAAGLYPVESVAAMARIAIQAESKEQFIQKVNEKDYLIRGTADRRVHAHGQHCQDGFAVPPDDRHHRHDDGYPQLPETRAELGRPARHERGIQLGGRALPFCKMRRARLRTREKGRHHRHHGRHPQRKERKLQPDQHRNDLKPIAVAQNRM